MLRKDLGVQFLLHSKDPSVRYFTLTEVLSKTKGSEEVRATQKRILRGLVFVLFFRASEPMVAMACIGTRRGPERLGAWSLRSNSAFLPTTLRPAVRQTMCSLNFRTPGPNPTRSEDDSDSMPQ